MNAPTDALVTAANAVADALVNLSRLTGVAPEALAGMFATACDVARRTA
jgi:hypothetical protein